MEKMRGVVVASDLKWWLRDGCFDFSKGCVRFSEVSFGGGSLLRRRFWCGYIAPARVLMLSVSSDDCFG